MFGKLRGQSVVELKDLRLSRQRGVAQALSSDHRRLLDALEANAGRPVSVRQLEQAGVANPATLIYELEVGGVAIDHVYEPGSSGHKRLVGFRLTAARPDAPRRSHHLQALFSRFARA